MKNAFCQQMLVSLRLIIYPTENSVMHFLVNFDLYALNTSKSQELLSKKVSLL